MSLPLTSNSPEVSGFLKTVSHKGRLTILCHLVSGEKSVSELIELLSERQAAVSQQLARLRLSGLITHRREGKSVYYKIADNRVVPLLEVIYELFCDPSRSNENVELETYGRND